MQIFAIDKMRAGITEETLAPHLPAESTSSILVGNGKFANQGAIDVRDVKPALAGKTGGVSEEDVAGSTFPLWVAWGEVLANIALRQFEVATDPKTKTIFVDPQNELSSYHPLALWKEAGNAIDDSPPRRYLEPEIYEIGSREAINPTKIEPRR